MIGKMIKLNRAAKEQKVEANFVLVSLDAGNESSKTLSKLRESHKLTSAEWYALRGDSATLRELAVLLGISFRVESGGEIVHSNRIVVLDPNGRIVMTRDGLDDNLTGLLEGS